MNTQDIERLSKIVRQRTVEETIPDHEILLSFNNDADAEAFDNWWLMEGKSAFVAWAKTWEA